jgi:hypothetical protein
MRVRPRIYNGKWPAQKDWPLPVAFGVLLGNQPIGICTVKQPSALNLRPRLLAIVLGLLPTLGMAVDFDYRLGPVDNEFLRNPEPAPSLRYGTAMASGDFNDDNIADLAIVSASASEVQVLFGLEWEVGTAPLIKFNETVFSIPFELSNPVLVSGDFDHDGDDELAIGETDSGSVSNAGSVLVMRNNGLSWVIQETIEQGANGYSGVAESGDWLGSSLAVGDFDNDGFDDLAIGARGEDVSTVNEAGAVLIAYGSSTGITGARDVLITRNSDGLTVPATVDERYGSAVASGDFNADGFDDIAIGVPRAHCPNGTDSAGAVVMMLGSASGIVNTGTRQFRPGVLGVAGSCTDNMMFGLVLAAGGFDLGETTDLAIATGENAVHVLYGEAVTGLVADGDQRITAASLPGGTGVHILFGAAMAAGRFNSNPADIFPGRSSLAIGATLDTVDGVSSAGSVSVIPGSSSGLIPAETVRYTRSASLEGGPPATGDALGGVLAGGDFNSDGARDLAIGIPFANDNGSLDRGAVQVLYSSEFIFRDGFSDAL